MNIAVRIEDKNGGHVGPVVFDGPRVIGAFVLPENVKRIERLKGRVVIHVHEPEGVEVHARATREDAR